MTTGIHALDTSLSKTKPKTVQELWNQVLAM